MFRRQFKLTKKEEKGIADICQFTVHLYIKAWFQAPSAVLAPRIDLQLIKNLTVTRKSMLVSGIGMKK